MPDQNLLSNLKLEALKNFNLSIHEFRLTLLENAHLPAYGGSMLRGSFGNIFRKVSCFKKIDILCTDCPLKQSCAYAYIFQTSPESSTAMHFAHNKQIPRPYIFEPLTGGKTEYIAGDDFKFRLILIGNAQKFMPFFILSFKELGAVGITPRRHKFSLSSIIVRNDLAKREEEIFCGETQIVRNTNLPIIFSDILKAAAEFGDSQEISLEFLTPLRLKWNGEILTSYIPFEALMQNITIRIQMLNIYHCDGNFCKNLSDLSRKSSGIEVASKNIKWRRIERYSSRMQAKDTLSGLVGSITYKGNLKNYLPLLILGQYIHVGNKATFGLGKYILKHS